MKKKKWIFIDGNAVNPKRLTIEQLLNAKKYNNEQHDYWWC